MDHFFASFEPFLRAHGTPVVGLVLFFESLGLPLPGESLLVAGGVLAARGDLSPTWLLVYAWVGSVLGDNAGYLIGRLVGRRVLLRYGARVGLTEERFSRIEEVFAQYGPIAVMFARFVNILRQLNGVVAGVAGMPWGRFLLFNVIGAGLWVLAWGGGALLFGRHLSHVGAILHMIGPWGASALALVIIALAAGILWLIKRRSIGGMLASKRSAQQ
ncbi:Membrane protein DedA with SNARE-associated domain [Hyphomicrobiales bacterium]|nr:Membrane protein DedA with SNARE-associated domain [Hyphomicrobiales bacterium]CAH1663958.1 Membrane protein DedA with SNARE-associated domain [Hyphomicrobiales bacterium]